MAKRRRQQQQQVKQPQQHLYGVSPSPLSKELLLAVHKMCDPWTRPILERALGWDPTYHPVVMPGIDFAEVVRSKIKPYSRSVRDANGAHIGIRDAYMIVLQLPQHLHTDAYVYGAHKTMQNYYKKKDDGTWEHKVFEDLLAEGIIMQDNDHSYLLTMEMWIGKEKEGEPTTLWTYQRMWMYHGIYEWEVNTSTRDIIMSPSREVMLSPPMSTTESIVALLFLVCIFFFFRLTGTHL